MKSGMMAAEEIFAKFKEKNGEIGGIQLEGMQKQYEKSWVHDELYQSRNFKSGFGKGLFAGLVHGGLTQHITKGKEPWTLAHTKRDSDTTELASKHKPIDYPKPDNVLTFDLLTNLSRSGTNHDHDQPSHLRVSNPTLTP